MSGSTFGVLMRVERRPYAVLALFVRRKNSFGKASSNFDMDGELSDGGDGIGMDSVVDIVLLGIGGSRCLAIRSRGGKCIFLERSNRLFGHLSPRPPKIPQCICLTYIKFGTTKPKTRNSIELS